MPTYRSINISLHSQFDIETFPEYPPEPKENYLARGISGFVPTLIDDTSSTCSVYVPALPGSTFWISYSVEPPVPAGHYFLFKLYINGAHIVSFSTGKEDGWEGKTMFGLFERSEGVDNGKRMEKRVLCFTPPDRKDHMWKDVANVHDETARLEIKVHRANGRRRTERVFEDYAKTPHAKNGKGISLVSAGRAGPEQPKRFYRFALTDPVDQPFATFRYYYRTWDQLRGLGLLELDEFGAPEDDNLPVIEPQDTFLRKRRVSDRAVCRQSEDALLDCEDGCATDDAESGDDRVTAPARRSSIRIVNTDGTRASLAMATSGTRANNASEHPKSYIPSGAPEADSSSTSQESNDGNEEDLTPQRNSCLSTPPRFYRLSIPPSIRLAPPKAASVPCPVPSRRSESVSSIAYRPHPAFAIDEWITQTPSPVKGVRDSITTPPMERDGARAGLSLMNILPASWRRRTVSGPSTAGNSKGRDGARSAT
ncbi:hypothetical protein T440DRAFT_116401 [Plenodomus tracheiphilus IPT5]|uniref:DUF7918 domain-containing protein n=1 Tax=Plenodomus tracheiphilus IPT5 TaxID=1408161 RepID=A0A6A7B756_9PLEO|nr:hypothetical protein T440DRAFT_116401 [Plenodomus tracheiphilus IPT5]